MTPARSAALLAAAVTGILLLALAWLLLAPRQVPTGQPPLTTLASGSLPGIKAAFNAADGSVRMVVMLSPT